MKANFTLILRRSILLILAAISLCFCPDDFVLIKTVPADLNFFTCDILGNLYIVQKKKLTKYDIDGNIIKTYDDKNLGDITSVDVTNPLKILVYYKDFNQIVFLDNTLSVSGSPILLEELGIAQSSYACTSYGNAFWVFDNSQSRLVRFDKNLDLQNQSDNLSQLQGMEMAEYMVEKSNSLYICNASGVVMIFDKYGTYGKTIVIQGINSFDVIGNRLYYLWADHLKSIDLVSYNDNSIMLPETGVSGFRINNDILYLSNNNGISIYKILKNN